jgi:ankyrin repeat protein
VQLTSDEPLATDVVTAIRTGDLDVLWALLAEHSELATAFIEFPDAQRSLLHVATDWPGHFPNNVDTVRLLIAAGADVNARLRGPHTETPLHWAASSDDVDVLGALLDAGADIEADGAVIAGGTALADATAFGQWNAARRLIERGARSNIFESAVMGLLDRVQADVDADDATTLDDISAAFWGACHGGQQATAEYLLDRGADIDWAAPWDGDTPLDAARRSEATTLADWLVERGARSART